MIDLCCVRLSEVMHTLVMPKSWSLASESPDWTAVMSWCKAPLSVSCCWNRFPCLDRRDLNSDDVKACSVTL